MLGDETMAIRYLCVKSKDLPASGISLLEGILVMATPEDLWASKACSVMINEIIIEHGRIQAASLTETSVPFKNSGFPIKYVGENT